MMIWTPEDDFSPEKIAESGQCFRWERLSGSGAPAWRILAAERALLLSPREDGSFSLSCTEAEWKDFWFSYFDLETDYRAIRALVRKEEDPFLYAACCRQAGIRILRQDLWEMTVSFLISQNRNIPAIKRSISLLCERAGLRLRDPAGEAFYAFPDPAAVAALSEEDLRSCSLGYRAPYVAAAARFFSAQRLDAAQVSAMPRDTADALFLSLPGVGPKVYACIRLFGLHDLDAFPKDVWIRRILESAYGGEYPFERYAPWNGIYQQYLFAYAREIQNGTRNTKNRKGQENT